MNPRWRNAASALLSTGAVVSAGSIGCGPANTYAPPPTPEVTVSPPSVRSLTTYLQYSGTTRGKEQVELRARVKGFLKEVRFQEGTDVKANEPMFVIDEGPFRVKVEEGEAKLKEAEASLDKAKKSKAVEVAAAQLSLDQAQLLLAQVEERRNRSLLARNAGSREDVDKTEAARKRAEAQVESDKASLDQARADFEINIRAAEAGVASARATLEDARINLGYCRISSPIDGRISRKLVDVGNLVGDATSTVLATVVKDDPMYAYMNVSDRDVLEFREMVREGRRVDFRKDVIPAELGMVNEKGFPHKGRIDYADPSADPGTSTVQARAVFDNPDHTIFPGLFVRVRVPNESLKDAVLVPDTALGTDQFGRFLLIVGAGDVVEKRKVVAGGRADDGLRLIETGLKPGELVVVDGLQRARPGLKVKPTRANEPATTTPPAAEARTRVEPAAPPKASTLK